MEPYFAYGSNMLTRDLRGRCPSARPRSRARLADHQLVFFCEDSLWGGGVAAIVPAPGEVVEGVLFELAPVDFGPLDEYEGVAEGYYLRARRVVTLASGAQEEAWVYLPGRDPTPPVLPSAAYMACLEAGAREHELSPAYRAGLAAAPRRPD